MVTIRDLAAHLQVGKSTVQRALSGQGGISPQTRERVLAAAAELGYRPDPLYSILGSQSRQSRSLSLALAYLDRDMYKDRRISISAAGVSSYEPARVRAEQLGYSLEHVHIDELGAGRRLMDVLYHRGYAGVLIGQTRTPDHEAILANTHLPVVCCGRIDPLPLHTVQPDIVQMVRLAWSQTLAAGYTRIGAAFGLHAVPIADDWERIGTFLACQTETVPNKRDRIPPNLSPMRDKAAAMAWLREYKPEAVIGFGLGSYYELRDGGVDMSRLAFVSLHTSLVTGSVGVAGVLEAKSIAHESVNLLDQLIRHRNVGVPEQPLRILVPGKWRDGESLFPREQVFGRRK